MSMAEKMRLPQDNKRSAPEERRTFYRVRMSSWVQIYLLDRMVETSTYTDINRTALVEDISLSGVLLWVPTKMDIDSLLVMEFPVSGKDSMFTARVVRLAGEKDGQFCYGCAFVDVTQKQIDDLCDELIRIQREGKGTIR